MFAASVFQTVALPVALAAIMTVLGLSLTLDDFRRVVAMPRGMLVGMANLALVAPLLSFAVATLFDLPPELAVGLVLLGAAPGGTMANFLTHLARGDTALSVSLTAVSSLAAVVTVPLYLGVATEHFGVTGVEDPSMVGVVARVFAITIVPLALGMWLRRRFPPEGREEGYARAKQGSLVLFVLMVAGAVATEYDVVLEHAAELAGVALALNVAAMAVAFTLSKLARLGDAQATAIAIELGLHNATLAIAVGGAIATIYTIPASVYASFMFVTGGLFAWAMARRNAPLSPPGPRPAPAPAASRPGPTP